MADACASDAAATDDRDDAQQYYAADGRRLCDGSLADRPFMDGPHSYASMLSSDPHRNFGFDFQNIGLLPACDTIIVFVFRGDARGLGGMFHVDIFSNTNTLKLYQLILYRYVSCARIVLADGDKDCLKQLEERIKRGRSWRYVGDIGVDAGIAGFFDGEKPDFSDSEWAEHCNWMREKDTETKKQNGGRASYWYIRCLPQTEKDGFWTSSGYGDGGYSAHAIHSIIDGKRMTTAAEIRFL